jgi:ABC-type phosphate transport system auxiliary subunit
MEIAEEMVLDAFERGKAFGFAEGMKSMRQEIEALKAENQFFKDLMGDVEILRKAQEI